VIVTLGIMAPFCSKIEAFLGTLLIPGTGHFDVWQPKIACKCFFSRGFFYLIKQQQLHDLFINFFPGNSISPVLPFCQVSTKILHDRILDILSITVDDLRSAPGGCIRICKIQEIGIRDIGLINIASHILNQGLIIDIKLSLCGPFK